MSEDGLKNKLVGILENIAFEDDDGFPYWLNSLEAEAIAIVLIEQGLKFDTVVSHTATFDRAQQERINALERENEELRARLEKAIELPCIEPITTYDWSDGEGVGKARFGIYYELLYRNKDGELIVTILEKEAAEARLKELQGGRGNVDNGG